MFLPAQFELTGIYRYQSGRLYSPLTTGSGFIEISPEGKNSRRMPSQQSLDLSAARLFLFGSRDIWFVVALPIFLDEELGWSFEGIGGFLAAWIIGYGIVQSAAPRLLPSSDIGAEASAARLLALILGAVAAAIALAVELEVVTTVAVVGGLIVFGVVFALNSSLHSYLVLAYSQGDEVSLDVGFYYSANATGRLIGTLLSGVLYLAAGLEGALWGSTVFLAVTWLLTLRLPSVGRDGRFDPAAAAS